jgi:hypothetical protein
VPLEEILSHCAHTAGRQALAKIRATAWAGQGVRFDRLFTGGALNPGGSKVDPPGSVEGDGADDDHDEDEPVHSLPLIAVRNGGNGAARSGPVPAREPNHPHVRIAIMGLLYWIVANYGLSGFHSECVKISVIQWQEHFSPMENQELTVTLSTQRRFLHTLSHQVLPDSDDSPDDGTVEAMNQCPGGGVLGCQDPRAELPTDVTVEAPEERLVSATDEPQRLMGRG